jgi:YggT family protein
MGSYLSDAALFLVDTILGIYILLVLFRLLLQLVRADFFNPISQFIVRATNPPLVRLRRFVPGLWGVDLAALLLLTALEAIRISLTAILLGHSPRFTGIIFLSLGELAKLAVYTVIFSIFIQGLLSWFSNGLQHPTTRLLSSVTDPILQPIRRILPAAGGIDLSPLIVFIAMMLVLKLGVQPIIDLGRDLTFF